MIHSAVGYPNSNKYLITCRNKDRPFSVLTCALLSTQLLHLRSTKHKNCDLLLFPSPLWCWGQAPGKHTRLYLAFSCLERWECLYIIQPGLKLLCSSNSTCLSLLNSKGYSWVLLCSVCKYLCYKNILLNVARKMIQKVRCLPLWQIT